MGGGDDTEAPRLGVTTAPDEVPGPRLTPYRFARNDPLERADGSLQNGSTGGTPSHASCPRSFRSTACCPGASTV